MLEWLLAAALPVCNPDPRPLIVAHRGGLDSLHPENTLPAFEHAHRVGADVIELDLRATRDGVVVVMHDATVDRTTNGRGMVSRLKLDAIQRLDAGNGVRVPTLTEVLEATRPDAVPLLLDLKHAAGLDLARVVATVREHDALGRVIFGVRTLEAHTQLAAGGEALHYLGFVPDPEQIDPFIDAGILDIRLWPRWADPPLVGHLHERGVRVWITTGQADVERLSELVALGANALLTDRPAAAAAHFRCRPTDPAR